MQRLRDAQPGGGQQADQRRIGLGLQRAGRRQPQGGEHKADNLLARIDVRHASTLAVAEVVGRGQFVLRVF